MTDTRPCSGNFSVEAHLLWLYLSRLMCRLLSKRQNFSVLSSSPRNLRQQSFLILELLLSSLLLFGLLPQGVLFTFISKSNNSNSDVSKTKSSSSSAPFHEENKEFEDDEIQKHRPSGGGHHKLGWSGWSDFSTCSRTCDGGVAFQLRRCHSPSGCRGESVRYRICNMQACPDQQDFRAQQCAAFNDVPYDGALFVWKPHYDYSEPCALTCRYAPTKFAQ